MFVSCDKPRPDQSVQIQIVWVGEELSLGPAHDVRPGTTDADQTMVARYEGNAKGKADQVLDAVRRSREETLATSRVGVYVSIVKSWEMRTTKGQVCHSAALTAWWTLYTPEVAVGGSPCREISCNSVRPCMGTHTCETTDLNAS